MIDWYNILDLSIQTFIKGSLLTRVLLHQLGPAASFSFPPLLSVIPIYHIFHYFSQVSHITWPVRDPIVYIFQSHHVREDDSVLPDNTLHTAVLCDRVRRDRAYADHVHRQSSLPRGQPQERH